MAESSVQDTGAPYPLETDLVVDGGVATGHSYTGAVQCPTIAGTPLGEV